MLLVTIKMHSGDDGQSKGEAKVVLYVISSNYAYTSTCKGFLKACFAMPAHDNCMYLPGCLVTGAGAGLLVY